MTRRALVGVARVPERRARPQLASVSFLLAVACTTDPITRRTDPTPEPPGPEPAGVCSAAAPGGGPTPGPIGDGSTVTAHLEPGPIDPEGPASTLSLANGASLAVRVSQTAEASFTATRQPPPPGVSTFSPIYRFDLGGALIAVADIRLPVDDPTRFGDCPPRILVKVGDAWDAYASAWDGEALVAHDAYIGSAEIVAGHACTGAEVVCGAGCVVPPETGLDCYACEDLCPSDRFCAQGTCSGWSTTYPPHVVAAGASDMFTWSWSDDVGTLMRYPLDPVLAPEALLEERRSYFIERLVTDGERLFWLEEEDDGRLLLRSMATRGGAATTLAQYGSAGSSFYAGPLRAFEGTIYYVVRRFDGSPDPVPAGVELFRVSGAGGTPELVERFDVHVDDVALTAGRLLLLIEDATTSYVWSMPIDGGPPIEVAQSPACIPRAIAVDGDVVYHALRCDGTIQRSSVMGGSTETMLAEPTLLGFGARNGVLYFGAERSPTPGTMEVFAARPGEAPRRIARPKPSWEPFLFAAKHLVVEGIVVPLDDASATRRP